MNGRLFQENESGGFADLCFLEWRKRRAERGATAAIVFRPNATTMRFDNGSGDGESEAHSMGFGRVELIEQMFQSIYGNSRAGIDDLELDLAMART